MSAPEHPDWLERQVSHEFSWLDDCCGFDDHQFADTAGEDGLAALGLTLTQLCDSSNYDLHELLDDYARNHADDDADEDEDGTPTAAAVLFEKIAQAREALCPRDSSCECTQDANDDFKSHMDELLGYFATSDDIVAVGDGPDDEVRIGWDVPDWSELQQMVNPREWDAMRLSIDYDAGTAQAGWGQYGGFRTVRLTRLRGQATLLWAAWSDYDSHHNLLDVDPVWAIATMTPANVAMVHGLSQGNVDIGAHLDRARFADVDSAGGYNALWHTLCALKLNEAPEHVQRVLGSVGPTWDGTLDELLTTVGAATEAAA